jgi:hypothetical protein
MTQDRGIRSSCRLADKYVSSLRRRLHGPNSWCVIALLLVLLFGKCGTPVMVEGVPLVTRESKKIPDMVPDVTADLGHSSESENDFDDGHDDGSESDFAHDKDHYEATSRARATMKTWGEDLTNVDVGLEEEWENFQLFDANKDGSVDLNEWLQRLVPGDDGSKEVTRWTDEFSVRAD